MESSICSLIALDLIHSDLVDGEVDLAALAGLPLTDQALKGNNWLLAYEGGRRLWLGNPDIAFIEADPCFAALLNADVSFYDQEARLPAIFQVKIEVAEAIDFDSDDEIDSDFEFDSMDEEYFDSAVTDTDEEDEEQGAAGAGKGNLAVDPEAPDDW